MLKYGYDESGNFYMKMWMGQEGIKTWNKMWEEEFKKHNNGQTFQKRKRRVRRCNRTL